MILVTGATGLVGSRLLYELVSRGRQVRALKRKNSSMKVVDMVFTAFTGHDPLPGDVEWVEGDTLDIYSLEEVMTGVSDVYHCAAVVSFDPRQAKTMMTINTEGTANVVNTALNKNVRKLCHVSSIAALGRPSLTGMIDEDSRWVFSGKTTPYAVSKYESEREVWRGIAEGLKAVIVNPSVIVGTGDPAKESGKLIDSIHRITAFYTNGVNGFIGVGDVAKAMILLMDSEISDERFVLSAENLSYREIFSMIAEGFEKHKPWIRLPSFFLAFVWGIERIRSLLWDTSPLITQSMVSKSVEKNYYSGEKIKDIIDFTYTPVREAVKEACMMYQTLINRKT
jgi:dihydroflavonol-4-reductase